MVPSSTERIMSVPKAAEMMRVVRFMQARTAPWARFVPGVAAPELQGFLARLRGHERARGSQGFSARIFADATALNPSRNSGDADSVPTV